MKKEKEKERWRWIKGYKNYYLISSWGRVYSVTRKKKARRDSKGVHYLTIQRGGIKKLRGKDGCYKVVELHKENKKRYFLVHRLVAAAFIPNPENKPWVNHKNFIKDDNYYKNLEWATPAEDSLHKNNGGRARGGSNKGELNTRAKTNTKTVLKIRKLTKKGLNYTQIAKMVGLSRDTASRIARRLLWRHLK